MISSAVNEESVLCESFQQPIDTEVGDMEGERERERESKRRTEERREWLINACFLL